MGAGRECQRVWVQGGMFWWLLSKHGKDASMPFLTFCLDLCMNQFPFLSHISPGPKDFLRKDLGIFCGTDECHSLLSCPVSSRFPYLNPANVSLSPPC